MPDSTKFESSALEPAAPSGGKFRNRDGIVAIKDGIKAPSAPTRGERQPKPPWLRVKVPGGEGYRRVKDIVDTHRLSTVCQESHCPNIAECWSHGTATLMLMGSVCTRACRFCAVDTGNPQGWLDHNEPENAAASVALMKLKYVVLTSVDRDDLPDGGAAHYAACVRAIRARNPDTAVEALTPDFAGDLNAVRVVVNAGIQVFAQNIETVERLTHPVRDPRASYAQSRKVLRAAKSEGGELLTKTSLLLGLGESDAEIRQTMEDLRADQVDILTLGQYLQPTRNHLKVERWVTPNEFTAYRELGLELGFLEVASGPLVRSSYRADRVFEQNNLGLAMPATPGKGQPLYQRLPLTQLD